MKQPGPPKGTRVFTFNSTVYIALFTFVFLLGIQLSISLSFVTPVACKDNLKIGLKGNFLMSPLCNLKSLVTPAGIIEWVSEIKQISTGRIGKSFQKQVED